MIECKDIHDDLKAFLDGELSLLRRASVRLHLARCADCRAAAALIDRISAELRADEVGDMDPALRYRILARAVELVPEPTRVRGPRRLVWRSVVQFAGAAAAVAVAALLVWPYYDNPREALTDASSRSASLWMKSAATGSIAARTPAAGAPAVPGPDKSKGILKRSEVARNRSPAPTTPAKRLGEREYARRPRDIGSLPIAAGSVVHDYADEKPATNATSAGTATALGVGRTARATTTDGYATAKKPAISHNLAEAGLGGGRMGGPAGVSGLAGPKADFTDVAASRNKVEGLQGGVAFGAQGPGAGASRSRAPNGGAQSLGGFGGGVGGGGFGGGGGNRQPAPSVLATQPTDRLVNTNAAAYQADITLDVDRPEAAVELVAGIARKAGGEVSEQSVSPARDGAETASLELRVPADRLLPVLGDIAKLGIVRARTVADNMAQSYSFNSLFSADKESAEPSGANARKGGSIPAGGQLGMAQEAMRKDTGTDGNARSVQPVGTDVRQQNNQVKRRTAALSKNVSQRMAQSGLSQNNAPAAHYGRATANQATNTTGKSVQLRVRLNTLQHTPQAAVSVRLNQKAAPPPK